MANDADYLLKSNYDVQSVSTISSKKLNTTKYGISIVALIIGLVLINIIFALFYYIGLLVDKTKEEKSLRPLWISNGVILIVLLFALIAWYNGSIEDRNTRIESRQHEIITEPFSSY